MRAPIFLDLRNIKDKIVRSQLRKLSEAVQDQSAALVAPALMPQQPGNTTIVNNPGPPPIVIPPPPDWTLFDDMQRLITDTTVPNPAFGELPWVISNSSGAITTDTTTFPAATNPGVFRFAPGGNIGEFNFLGTQLTLTANYFVARPRGKLTIRIGAGIDGTAGVSQRKHFRVGFGYYPANAEWPAWYIGFVWWFTDQDYRTEALTSYASLQLNNDPGAGNRTDLFMTEVVTNNAAVATVIGAASAFTGIADLAIELQNGIGKFYSVAGGPNGVRTKIDERAIHAAGDGHGTPIAQMRSHGTANLGGTRFGYLDYYAMRGDP